MKKIIPFIFYFFIIVSFSYGADRNDKQNLGALNKFIKTLPHTEEALYPSEAKKIELAQRHNLTKKQVENAFSNFRNRGHLVFKKKVNRKLWEVGTNWLQGAALFLLSEIPVEDSQMPALVFKDGRFHHYFVHRNQIVSTEISRSQDDYAAINSFSFNGSKTILSAKMCRFFNSLGAQIVIGENLENPYPTASEYETIARMSNATLSQVKDWFINIRRRKLHGNVHRKRKHDECIAEKSTFSKKRRVESREHFSAFLCHYSLLADVEPTITISSGSFPNCQSEEYPIHYVEAPFTQAFLVPLINVERDCWASIRQPPPPTRKVEIREGNYSEPFMEQKAKRRNFMELEFGIELCDELLIEPEPSNIDWLPFLSPDEATACTFPLA